MGPCLRQLLAFDAIATFACGAAGEASPDFERWTSTVASASASGKGRLIGARTNAQAQGCIAWRLPRRIGLAVFNVGASLKIGRCEFARTGGHEATQCRKLWPRGGAAGVPGSMPSKYRSK